jgi:hypothetical protein
VKQRVREWDQDGLALPDQLMAAYGPAMEVYGRYGQVLRPDGSTPPLEHYLTLARTAVRDATALRLDELPLETFDAATRFAVFWLRLYGRSDVPKGEARFLAQADALSIDDLRGPLLTESRAGFRLRTDAPAWVGLASSTFEVARALAAAWDAGGTDAVASVIAEAERDPADRHLWAVVKDMAAQLPPMSSRVVCVHVRLVRRREASGHFPGVLCLGFACALLVWRWAACTRCRQRCGGIGYPLPAMGACGACDAGSGYRFPARR